MDEIATVFKVEFNEAIVVKLIEDHSDDPNPNQSGTSYSGGPERALDGDTNGVFNDGSVTHTPENLDDPWWLWDMGDVKQIDQVKIWNRTDCCGDRLADFYLFISEDPILYDDVDALVDNSDVWSYFHEGAVDVNTTIPVDQFGQYVKIQISGIGTLSLAEVEINPVSSDNRIDEDPSFGVYPNPLKEDTFRVELPNDMLNTSVDFHLYNQSGQYITIDVMKIDNMYKIKSCQELPTGIYILNTTNGDKTYSEKIVKK